jgi:uncharacterized membrane protein YeiB
VALVAQFASGVIGFFQDGGIGDWLLTSAVMGVVLLLLIRRRQERAWLAFLTVNAVGTTLLAGALVWAPADPAVHLEVNWTSVVLTVVSVGAILAPGVRPPTATR